MSSIISQLPNLCTGIRTIDMLAATGCFENNVLFENTAQIYLINLHWKLGLGFKLRLRVALF